MAFQQSTKNTPPFWGGGADLSPRNKKNRHRGDSNPALVKSVTDATPLSYTDFYHPPLRPSYTCAEKAIYECVRARSGRGGADRGRG